MRSSRARRLLWFLLALDLVLLGGTGAGLTINYRPDTPTFPTDGRAAIELHPGGGLLRDLHWWLAVAAVFLLAALVLQTLLVERAGGTGSVLAICVPVAATAIVVAWISGVRLPWTILALETPEQQGIRGIWYAAFDPLVRFVIVGGQEVGQPEYRSYALVHLFAAPAALVVALSGLRVRAGMRRPRPTPRGAE